MSISSAFGIVTSGLRANQVQSELVASNIANAQTAGYSRKSAELITRQGAVEVAGVARSVDPLLDRLDRANISQQSRANTIAQALGTYTAQLGQPTDESSPSAMLTNLYTALLTLSSAPASSAAQLGVVSSASALVDNLASLSTTLSELDREIDLNIRYDVADVNDALTRLGQINTRLAQSGGTGREGAELLDEQSRLLDQVAGFMEIQTTTRADGGVNVYTSGGTELLAGRRVTLVSYDSARGTLMAGEAEITPGASGSRGFSGGSLAGLFELRDQSVPQLRAELDGYAAMLVERFTSIDSSLMPGESGLFIDSNPQLGTQLGLAGRFAVNPVVLATQGGSADRLATGLGSGTPLPPGDAGLISAMMSMIDTRVPGTTPLGEGISLNAYATSMVAGQQQMRAAADTVARQAEVSGATISASRQNLQGVNIDDELQVLMVIEQSFAANSRVLTSLQTMLDDLLNAV